MVRGLMLYTPSLASLPVVIHVAQFYRYLTLLQGFARKQGFIHNFSSCTSLTKVGATLTILHVYFKK
jgi:hypothetical protein